MSPLLISFTYPLRIIFIVSISLKVLLALLDDLNLQSGNSLDVPKILLKYVTQILALGQPATVRPPFASPTDWRDHWIYFLMIDRFNHPTNPPASAWNQPYGRHQGGSFKGIEQQLDYLKNLGVGAIWITAI